MTLLELQRRMAEDVRRPLTADFEMRDTVSLRSLLPTQLSCEGEGEVRQR